MKYRVHFTDSASADAERAYVWLAEQVPRAAVKWFNGLLDVVESLESFPTRCAIAPESENADEEIRQMLYGRRPHVYRILFIIRGKEVFVIHIRHGARQAMQRGDIAIPPDTT
ncbi:MAG TPA: type II toxin-antitoxin system RelE/ParE family toxin [Tepidisphaeraceae bacterium]|jgi:plasmid stabilization system protein ParE